MNISNDQSGQYQQASFESLLSIRTFFFDFV